MKPIRNPRQLSLFTSSYEIGAPRAARLLNTSVDTVKRLIESGELQAYKLHEAGWWKVSYESVVAYRNKIRQKYALDEPYDRADQADHALVR
jgi:excisionase family DNA binding protein